ncbi:MAG: transporter substrate-binding domain-containing protein [Anaerolineae bacterium]|nr:transporter substrate-binding domain-containing protein [Anaerolineae bacterium]
MLNKNHNNHAHLLLIIVLVILLTLVSTATLAAQDSPDEPNEPLKVYTSYAEPFVIVEPERLSGFSIDLWKEIALRTELEYEWVVVDNFTDILDNVESGEADVGMSVLVITAEREEVMDFSIPFFVSGLRVMSIKDPIRPFSNIFSAIFSLDVLKLLIVFFGLIMVAANVIWFFERQTNDNHFPKGYLAGIWEAIWWAAVTVTTVGYGDKVPLGKVGRVLALFWMVTGLFLVANLTAGVTAHITVMELQGHEKRLQDMARSTVVTIADTAAEEFLIQRGIKYITAENLEEAHQMLKDDRAAGVVLNAPLLTYYAQQHGNDDLEVMGETFEEQYTAIALPQNSPYREIINQALLTIFEDGTFDEIYLKWFGEEVEW